jgi:hypothetical protein
VRSLEHCFQFPFSAFTAMAWITPNIEQCQQRITGAEWSALSRAALQAGQDGETMASDVITTQVNRIRGRVAARPENQLGAAGTIPDELHSAFLALWVYEFITRLPGMKSLLDDRRVDAQKSAESELRDVSNGKIRIVPPITAAAPAEQAAVATISVVKSTTRRATRANTSGLL